MMGLERVLVEEDILQIVSLRNFTGNYFLFEHQGRIGLAVGYRHDSFEGVLERHPSTLPYGKAVLIGEGVLELRRAAGSSVPYFKILTLPMGRSQKYVMNALAQVFESRDCYSIL